MASPQRIFTIYSLLCQRAETIRDELEADGKAVSGTVKMCIKKDREKLLARWAEEMNELMGVLDGSHDDPYIMEATQCFYWASLYAVTGGDDWKSLDYEAARRDLNKLAIQDLAGLNETVERLLALGAEKVPARKLFMLWMVADRFYREQTPVDKQWSIEQIMDYDLGEMKTRPYLQSIIQDTVSI